MKKESLNKMKQKKRNYYWMRIWGIFLLFTLCVLSHNAWAIRDDVLIVVNENSIDSPLVGEYYAQQRGVDPANIAYITVPNSYFITWTDFKIMRDQLIQFMQQEIVNRDPSFVPVVCTNGDVPYYCQASVDQLRANTKFRYIVTTKGVPTRMVVDNSPFYSPTGPTSVDNYLKYWLLNYYTDDVNFVEAYNRYNAFMDGRGMRIVDPAADKELIVGRIDGLTLESAQALVDRAIANESNGLYGKMYGHGQLYYYIQYGLLNTGIRNVRMDWKFQFGLFDETAPECSDINDPNLYLNFSASSAQGKTPLHCKVKITSPYGGGNEAPPAKPYSRQPIVDDALVYYGYLDGQPTNGNFDHFLNWRKDETCSNTLCRNAPDPAACRLASTDVFKEIDTRCVGVADGFIGYNYQSYPVSFMHVWPSEWYQSTNFSSFGSMGGGDVNNLAFPHVRSDGGFDDGYSLFFGNTDRVATEKCYSSNDFGVAPDAVCTENMYVNLNQLTYFPSKTFDSNNPQQYRIQFRYKGENIVNPNSTKFRVKLLVHETGTPGKDKIVYPAKTFSIPIPEGNTDWTLSQEAVFQIDPSVHVRPENGTLTGVAPNIVYTPDPGFVGNDSFTFQVSDGQSLSNIAVVSITVINPTPLMPRVIMGPKEDEVEAAPISAVNSIPVALSQNVNVSRDTPQNITLSATDADGDPLTYQAGVWNSEFDGIRVTLETTNRTLKGNLWIDNIVIEDINAGIDLARNGSFTDGHEQVSAGDHAANFLSRLNGTAFFGSLSHHQTGGGSFRLHDSETLLYFMKGLPLGDAVWLKETGLSGILYGDPLYSPTAVRIAPFADTSNNVTVDTVDVYGSVLNGFDPSIVITTYILDYCLGNDFYVCDQNNSWISTGMSGGGGQRDVLLGTWDVSQLLDGNQYTLRLSVTSINSLTGLSQTFNDYNVFYKGAPIVNRPPVATNQFITVETGVPIDITLVAVDPDGDPLTYVTGTTINGTITGTPPNVTFTSTPGYIGNNASINWIATDGTQYSDLGRVYITVIPASLNSPPVAQDQNVSTNQDTDVAITLQASDSNGDPLTYTVVNSPINGTLAGTVPDLVYTPNAGFTGLDSFTFQANDGTVDSNTATVSVSVLGVNRPPAAQDQSVVTNQNTAVDILLQATDSDGDSLSYTITNPSNGVITGTPPNITYTPMSGFMGNDSFTFIVNDGTIDSNTATVSVTVVQASGPMPVTWIDKVGVSSNGNTITKTASNLWGNAGAASLSVITQDGSISFSSNETDKRKMCGLSSNNRNAHYKTIVYAIHLNNEGGVVVFENGRKKGAFGTYQTTDVFSIERVGTTIEYKKNGTLFYTSAKSSSGNLIADAAIYHTNGTIANAIITGAVPPPNRPPVIQDQNMATERDVAIAFALEASDLDGDILSYTVTNPSNGVITGTPPNVTYTPTAGFMGNDSFTFKVNDGEVDSNTATVSMRVWQPSVPLVWTDLVGVGVNGNTITKTDTNLWGNAGAASTNVILQDGGVIFKTNETNKRKICGLSLENKNAHYKTIGYAIFLSNKGTVAVYENGVKKGNFGTYQTTDVFSVERGGATIEYRKNGRLFYTSTKSSAGILVADAAIYHNNGTISNARTIGAVPQPNRVPAAQFQSGLTEQNIPLDIVLQATDADGDNLTYSVVSNPTNGTLTGSAPNLIYTPNAGYMGNDSFTFKVNDGEVDSNTATVSIKVRQSSVPIVWTDLVGMSVNGNTITKTETNSWGNAGAASTNVILQDGGVIFKTNETNKRKICGLSSTNTNAHYSSIEYAILLNNVGAVVIYESGVKKGTFGTYQPTDIFSVERAGTTIEYWKNGDLLYTSTKSSSGNLMADAAIYHTNGTIADARIMN